MSKPVFVTENNTPNVKIIAMTVAGLLIPLYLTVAPMFGLPTFDQQWMIDNLETIIGGVVAVMAIVGYFKKPGKGDGVVEKTD